MNGPPSDHAPPSEQRARLSDVVSSLVESLVEPALLADEGTGTIIAANDAAAKLWGFPRETLVGLHQWELHPNQDADFYRRMFDQHLKTPCDQEAEILRADGSLLPVRISASRVAAEGRQYLLGLFRDRSSEAATRLKLEEYRAWMQVIADNAPVAVSAVDARGRLLFWNRGAEGIFGWKADEILGRSDPTIPSGARDEVERRRKEVLQGRTVQAREVERHRKDGSVVWIRTVNAPIPGLGDKAHGVVAVAEDITERVLARRRLTRIERGLRARAALAASVVRVESEEDLYREACSAAVREAGYRLAWVGIAMNDLAKTVEPVASAGVESDYLQGIRITWDDSKTGSGPTGRAIREGKPIVASDIESEPDFEPWRESALIHGYRSSAALPLTIEGRVEGALNLYAEEADAFDDDEIALLKGLAQDLSLAAAAARSRKVLRREIERTRQLLVTTLDGYVLVDADGRILDANPAYCRLVGLTREKLLSMKVGELEAEFGVHIETAGLLDGPHGGSQRFTTGYRREDGTQVHLDVSATTLTDADRLVMAAFVRDVYREMRLREELDESRANLQLIYDTASDVLFQLAVEEQDTYRFVSVNKAFLEATGLREDQVVGKLTSKVIAEPSHSMVLAKYAEAIRTRQIVHWEETTPYESGVRVGAVAVAPFFDGDGHCAYLIGSVHDVTERKRAELELERLNKELEQRVEERTAELRTAVDLMAGREIRMAELKQVIKTLCRQLEESGIKPAAMDPLLGKDD